MLFVLQASRSLSITLVAQYDGWRIWWRNCSQPLATRGFYRNPNSNLSLCVRVVFLFCFLKGKKVTASWSADGWAGSSAEPEQEAGGSDEETERVVGGSARLWPPSVHTRAGWINSTGNWTDFPKKWRVAFRVNTDTFVLWLINNEAEKLVCLNFAAWLASIGGHSPP